ncbi:MAG: hypothetical protein CBC13_05695 [Planctomycetia bacterium TMED53]|nr:MAG: hypothetical protein CBC13_05695 [Planctomycetia bacterium TMED53]
MRNGIKVLFLLLGVVFVAPALEGQCPPGSWVLTGQVVDEAGIGVGGLDLDLTDPVTGLQLILSGDFTFADGAFSMTVCQVTAPGNYLLHVNPAQSDLYFPLENVQISLNGDASLGVFALEAAAIVEGRVVGENFEFLPFVDLDFVDSVTGIAQPFSGDFTIADGTFSTKVLPGFWDVQFTASLASTTLDMVPRELRDTLITGVTDLGDVRLREGRTLSGTVVDLSGVPVSDADIDARDLMTGEKIVTPGDNTDGSGAFQVLVPVGQFEVEIDPPFGSTLVPILTTVDVPATGLDVGTITLEQGVAVTGLVVDSVLNPIAGTDLDFIISATGIEIQTAHDNADSSGVFSVQVVPDTYDIAFRPSFITGFAPLVVPGNVIAANTDLGNVTLPAGIALTGTVLAGGTAVTDATIELFDPVSGQPTYLFGNDTDGLGAFAIRQVSGIYDLLVIPPLGSGLPSYSQAGIDLTADVNLGIDLLGTPPPTPPSSIASLNCCCPSDVVLDWVLGEPDYDLIQIFRQGSFLTSLSGDSTSFSDTTAPPEVVEYQVIAIRNALVSSPVGCTLDNTPGTNPLFVRGDANDDGNVNVADAISTLQYLFNGAATPDCLSALDANDSGSVNIADAIHVLGFLFSGGPPPANPFPNPGQDPTPGALPCI